MSGLTLGIDVGADRLHCVAIDAGLALTDSEIFKADEIPRLGDWAKESAVVAVDAPAQLSIAAHRDDPQLSPKFRVARCAEIALGLEFGHWVPWVTPTKAPVMPWMATGFRVFDELRARGVVAIECYPYAGHRELLGPAPLPKKATVEGVRSRIAGLRNAGITQPNLAMWSHDGLDALLGALIAYDYKHGNARRAGCGHDESAIWLPAVR